MMVSLAVDRARGHRMSIHLQREIDKLKRDLLLICSIVKERVQKAIRALFDRDAKLAERGPGNGRRR